MAKAVRKPAKVTSAPKRPKAAVRPVAQRAAKANKPKAVPVAAPASNLSSEAIGVAQQIEQALKEGRLDVLTPEAMQVLIAALCKLYSANVEQGAPYLPVNSRSGVTPTDVMVVASKLLRATNLQVFELGMWQSWTGR
ncbi:MAG TPA: hypothetical protein VL966_15310 [Alphaproteobacteria bacterium]|jgi:hypothetical protein|nr:hypothetical protein [Alphaproteobacteria bacterium]